MTSNEQVQDEIQLNLITPPGAPYSFSVVLRNESSNNTEFILEVTGINPASNKTAVYTLSERDHNAYLNLFEQLSSDFGLRLPQNRRALPKPTFQLSYKEVLTTNVAEGMLYGYGDPAAIRVKGDTAGDDWYYLVSTSNDAPDSFPIIRSKNLEDWEFVAYVFPKGLKPEWAADGEFISDYWAPEIHFVQHEYRLYFVARDKETLELCIGMARSHNPEGPYIADASPLLKGNTIDPHIYIENDNSYLLWKEDNNEAWPSHLNDLLYSHPELITKLFEKKEDQLTVSFLLAIWPWARALPPMERFQLIQSEIEAVIAVFADFYDRLKQLTTTLPGSMHEEIRTVLYYMKTPVYLQQLSSDGSSLVGERTKLIQNDLSWEAHLVEGIWLTQQNGHYYLFYAGNDFSTDQYGIGVAMAGSLLGPYQKMPSPFLQSTEKWWAPGHPSVVTGPDEQPLMFLHAFFPHQAGYKKFRALLSIQLKFEKDQVSIRGDSAFTP